MPSFVHGRNTVVLFDQRDLTRYFNEATTTRTLETAETTCFGAPQGAREYIPGIREDSMTLQGFVDNVDESVLDAEGIDKILTAYLNTGLNPVVTVGPGGSAYGAKAAMLSAYQVRYEPTSAVDEAVTFEAEFSAASGTGVEEGVFIKALGNNTASAGSSSTATGTTLDNGAATSPTNQGYVAHFHVSDASGAGSNIVGKVMHSADNVAWVALATFATLNAVPGAQRLAGSGLVNRYVRSEVVVTAGGGAPATYRSAMAFARL